ncbi:hypothetical protein QVN60_03980 [Yersinia aleksiciae]|uniref:hypothetical protein n=1 Tax=Yersinia aleksiciae TaxID=263819 RepID=UPI000A4DC91D|nr:hypothetical protein [Yersinia aleksiciae]MDN0122370.1 hypothetical protein [Yersinia aleksiciae]
MKLSNCLSLLALILPLSGCASRPDYTLNPPASSEWVTVTVKLPSEMEVLPLDVLYRSDKCQREVYDEKTESHTSRDRGVNPHLITLQNSGDIRQARVALEGGGKCEWKLSGIRVGLQLARTLPLVTGKNIISTNYVFDFDNEGYRNAFGEGAAKKTTGDLYLKSEFFPIITHHRDNEVTIKLFGGDTRYEQWNRYYRVYNIKQIVIEPVVYLSKVVTLNPPKLLPGNITATYPDGSKEEIPNVNPNYEKLLSMK